jgi:hypothetical protein
LPGYHKTSQFIKLVVTHLHIFKRILLTDAAKNILFARLLQLAREKYFVKNVVRLGEGEDDIKLAHIAVVFVHLFDVSVNNFEGNQLVVFGRAASDEEERSISAVDDLSICSEVSLSSPKQITKRGGEKLTLVFEEVAHARSTSEHKLRYILDDLGLVLG